MEKTLSAADTSSNATTDEIAEALLGLQNTEIKFDASSEFPLNAGD